MASKPSRLIFSREFDRNFGKLPKDIQRTIINRLEDLASQPYSGKLLKGVFKGSRSLRVGDHRIIYAVSVEKGEIHVLTVGHRRQVYKP